MKSCAVFPMAGVLVLLGLCPQAAADSTHGSVTGKVAATPEKYLKDTVVFLKNVPFTRSPKTVAMDQRAMHFIPHILTITAGDTVRFLNHDSVPHNVFSPEGGYNLGTFPPGAVRTHTFPKPGVYTQLCTLHPEMIAYVVVGENPFSSVVDRDGRFDLADVPPGKYVVGVWNPTLKAPERTVTVEAGQKTKVDFSLTR